MALHTSAIKEELANLRAKKADLERKIQGLEYYLGKKPHIDKTSAGTSGFSARGGRDIRPAVKEIFARNGNAPIKVKNLIDMVAERDPEVERSIIEKKMVHVKRTILEQVEYGKYRLKT